MHHFVFSVWDSGTTGSTPGSMGKERPRNRRVKCIGEYEGRCKQRVQNVGS